MKERTGNGLCYYCDATWYKCQNPKLYLLKEFLMDREDECDQEEKFAEEEGIVRIG